MFCWLTFYNLPCSLDMACLDVWLKVAILAAQYHGKRVGPKFRGYLGTEYFHFSEIYFSGEEHPDAAFSDSDYLPQEPEEDC